MNPGPAKATVLPIDTSFSFKVNDDPFERENGFLGQPIASPTRLSASPFSSRNIHLPFKEVTANTRPNEARKLLWHVLSQLMSRRKPASVWDALISTSYDQAERRFGALSLSFKEAVKGMKPELKFERTPLGQEDDSDDIQHDRFSTDETINLVIQLNNVLATSIAQGWHIFDERTPLWESTDGDGSKFRSSFRLSRGGRRSKSSSPGRGRVPMPELLSLCISVLGSIVAEDCRYRVSLPRPSRPPHTLQILTLKFAQFLAHTHRNDPRVISQIAFAMIPAFSTFELEMHSRLLAFFESGIIQAVLSSLQKLQGQTTVHLPHNNIYDPFDDKDPPVVSIKIEEVQNNDDTLQAPRFSTGQIQSTNNPHQFAQIYYLAFILPPFLSAIFDSIGAFDPNGTLILPSQLLKLLRGMANSKVDLYNDLLEIVALRGSKARRLAIACLAHLWPRAVGHSTISNAFCPPEHSHHQSVDIHVHQFSPWFWDLPAGRIILNDLTDVCRSCSKGIYGFCLRCLLCLISVHADCYDFPAGNSEIEYSMTDGLQVQRIGVHRFSCLHPNGELSVQGHCLRPTIWFTLCLCLVCRNPLWGCHMQGLRCERCSMPVHFDCLSSLELLRPCKTSTFTSIDMTIDWEDLRRSCLENFPILSCQKDQLFDRSYEEISIYRDVLRTQLQFLISGIGMGSIVISNSKSATVRQFELHSSLELCEQLLNSDSLTSGPSTEDYKKHINSTNHILSVMFDQSYLEYLSASIKSSLPQRSRPSSAFLNVEHIYDDQDDAERSLPYECVLLSHMRNILSVDFAIRTEDTAYLLINHLHQLAFFDRRDHLLRPFGNFANGNDIECIFPLPFSLDLSSNVETLISAIESCLTDLDLTVNEFGFLLLTRRFWPNGLASEQALTRLASKVFSWILDEDDKLAVVLREFIAKQSNMPGMRTPGYEVWPLQPLGKYTPNYKGNAGDFVLARRSILDRFALPWLLEFHDLDPDLYATMAFESCLQVVDNKDSDSLDAVDQVTKRIDGLLRGVIKLYSYSVTFTSFGGVMQRAIQQINEINIEEKPSPSLYRLCSSDSEATGRNSTLMNFGSGSADRQHITPMDTCRIILNLAQQSAEGLSQSLSILPVIIKSGVVISSSFFNEILDLIQPTNSNFLEDSKMFVRSLAFCLWLRSLGRQDLQQTISSLHTRISKHISDCLKTGRNVYLALSIIRYSLASCLLIYGCERSSIIANEFLLQNEADALASRRRLNVRGSETNDPIYIEPAILSALQLYMESSLEEILCLTIKFLHLFIVESPFLEAFEFDNFILRNGNLIAQCVWATYDVPRDDVATFRTHLFLRSLLIDSEPFEDILRSHYDPSNCSIEQRLSAVNRLFRIVSDVTSPAFIVEGQQWRPSVIEIFYQYFSALWSDPSEEIRLAVKVSSAALLPAHFDIISQCWNESFSKSPINDRIRLAGFLIQLHPHFPGWRVLSWETMIEVLAEYEGPAGHIDKVVLDKEYYKHQQSTEDPDMAHLRGAILLLSLRMISDGIKIDSFSLMKLKIQFVQFMGFSNISVMPTHNRQSFYLRYSDIGDIFDSGFPCVEEMAHVVDSSYYVELPQSALGIANSHDDKMVSVLVGAIFLDATLCIICTLRDLTALPVMTLKSLLESLYIILQKYDFEDGLFSHMQSLLRKAILRIVALLSKDDISYELRSLSLTIAQASIKRFYTFLGPAVPVILGIVIAEVAAQGPQSQDSLSVQGRLFIGGTLQDHCHSGLLFHMMRQPLQNEFFQVLKQVLVPTTIETEVPPSCLSEALLRDSLLHVLSVEPGFLPVLLQNICSFIQEVYDQGYSPELTTFVGQHLMQISRRLTDGTIEGADPTPLLVIVAVVMKHMKKHLRDFISYVDVVLRTSLTRLGGVKASTLAQLIRAAPVQPKSIDSMDVLNTLFDILADGLRLKTKIAPLTLKSLIEALLSADLYPVVLQSRIRERISRSLVDDSFAFLQNHIWTEENIDHDFKAACAAATLFLHGASRDSIFQRFIEPVSEKATRLPLSFRLWNIVVLVALQEQKNDWISMLCSHFGAFNALFAGMIRSYTTSGISSLTTATMDVNQSHIAIRLWLMLSNSMSTETSEHQITVSGIWNELWPVYEGLLEVMETEAHVGFHPTLVSLTTTSVADLLLCIQSLRLSLALDKHLHLAILCRLKAISRGDSSKIIRAIRSLSEPPPEISKVYFLDQIAKELVAVEKIRIAGDHNRPGGGERTRKEWR